MGNPINVTVYMFPRDVIWVSNVGCKFHGFLRCSGRCSGTKPAQNDSFWELDVWGKTPAIFQIWNELKTYKILQKYRIHGELGPWNLNWHVSFPWSPHRQRETVMLMLLCYSLMPICMKNRLVWHGLPHLFGTNWRFHGFPKMWGAPILGTLVACDPIHCFYVLK